MPDVITPAWVEKKRRTYRTDQGGKGGRILSSLLAGASTWGWPGNWTQDRLEQAFHFKHWLYVAIHRRANSLAELKPNLALVEGHSSHQKPRKAHSRNRYHKKSLHQIRPHEEVEFVGDDHPVARLLARPNETDTFGQLIYELTMYLDLTGNGYLWMVPNGLGLPCELWVIPSHWVWVRQGHGRWVDYFEVRPFVGTGILKFPPEEILWIKRKNPIHKYDGWAPTSAIAEWIDAAESIDRSRFWQFKNGAFPFGHLKLGESYLDPDQPDLERAYAKLFGRLQGEINYGRPLITGNDVEYTPLMISPMEMAYTQSADQLRDWVLAAYGVPKEVAGIQDAGSEIAMYGPMAQYCKFSLSPDLKLFAEAFTQHLCHRWDERLRLWWDDPTPDNPQEKRADIQVLAAVGALTPNEIRSDYGYEPYENGGDDPLLPMGVGPLPLNTGEELGDIGLTPAEQARYGSLDEPEADPLLSSAATEGDGQGDRPGRPPAPPVSQGKDMASPPVVVQKVSTDQPASLEYFAKAIDRLEDLHRDTLRRLEFLYQALAQMPRGAIADSPALIQLHAKEITLPEANLTQPAPVVHVHVPEQPAPVIHVQVPEQQQPHVVVQVPETDVHVHVREQPTPEVHVHVPEAKPRQRTIERDAAGKIIGIVES